MTHRILIVDDDPTLVEMLTFVLQRGGYQTAAANDGQRALELLQSERVDLVVLDVMLPDMDGYEICRRIRALPGVGSLPILMLSARTQVAHKIDGFESGADDYVPKPADPKEILARAKALLVRSARARPTPAPVVALLGAKGGVGCTTTALNVAQAIASGRRRIVVIEVAAGSASGPWLLALEPGEDLCSLAVHEGFRASMLALQPALHTVSERFGYIRRGSTIGGQACPPLSSAAWADVIQVLQDAYDIVLLDVSAGAVDTQADLLRQVSAVVPVTENSPLGIWHLRATLLWLEQQRADSRVPGFVLVDQSAAPTRESPSSLASAVGLGVLGLIPAAPVAHYQASVMRRLAYAADAESEVALAYAELAQRLVAVPIEAPVELRP